MLLLGSVALIICLLVFVNNRNEKQRRKKKFMQLGELGSANGLSFASQEMVKKTIMALDAVNRKLAMVEESGDAFVTLIIALDDIQKCTIKKEYTRIVHEGRKSQAIEMLLNEIALTFDFKNNKAPVVKIRFYDINVNSICQLPALEKKAADWEIMLIKLIKRQELQMV